jgi:galactitol-specific phosphotransferase system IIB component
MPSPVQAPVAQAQPAPQPGISEATATAILTAVEQQLTRYFGAMAARADAVQQAGEAGRTELVNHFQKQIDVLRGELERSQQDNATYEEALQTAIEERLTEFAASQNWRFGELENRFDRVNEEITLGLPAHFETMAAPIQQRLDRTTEVLAGRIEELQKAARRFDEQSSALVQHVNDTTASLSRRLDESARAFGGQLDERTMALSQRVDEAMTSMRGHVADQIGTFNRRLDDSDNRVVDRMLAMEERINDQTGVRLAAVEATIGRISSGIDDAIVAVSHRVIELENNNLAVLQRLDEVVESMKKVDEEAIAKLREQMSSAVGESMLVRIELERVASSTGEQFDKINVRMTELAAQIADADLDVSTAVQLERLEEIERALVELDPTQFVRKDELGAAAFQAPAAPTSPTAAAAFVPPTEASTDGNGSSTTHDSADRANPTESNLSSW